VFYIAPSYDPPCILTEYKRKKDTVPEPIKSPIGWIGIPENLAMVGNLQFPWRKYIADEPWYAPYAESKLTAGNRMNLRRHKVLQEKEVIVTSPTETPPVDDRMSPRKPKVPQGNTEKEALVVSPAESSSSSTDHRPTLRKRKLPQENEEKDTATISNVALHGPKKRPRTRKIGRPIKVSHPSPGADGDSATVTPSTYQGILHSLSTTQPLESTSPPGSNDAQRRQSRRQMERRERELSLSFIPNGRVRSISTSASTSEGSTAVSQLSPPPASDSSMMTVVEVVDEEKVEAGMKGNREQTPERRMRKVAVRPRCPPLVTRASARMVGDTRADAEDSLEDGKVVGKVRVGAATGPYPTNRKEQIASGRGKSVAVASGKHRTKS